MAVWDKKIPWSFILLLAGAASFGVNYSDPVCAVEGSSVTLPCTFTPKKSFTQDGKEVPLQVIRVRWCVRHLICHETTPSVYDSGSKTPNPRYQYLGDLRGNCTLQITDIQKADSTTFRFRMESDNVAGHYSGHSGVKVTVIVPKMRIRSSSDASELSQNQEVTLHCTANCTFHLLEVTWFKDGNALPHCGPALQLGPLTAEDSGNYTCALKTNKDTVSLPYAVRVQEGDEGMNHKLIVRVVLFLLHTVLLIIATAVIIKRTCVCKKAAAEN